MFDFRICWKIIAELFFSRLFLKKMLSKVTISKRWHNCCDCIFKFATPSRKMLALSWCCGSFQFCHALFRNSMLIYLGRYLFSSKFKRIDEFGTIIDCTYCFFLNRPNFWYFAWPNFLAFKYFPIIRNTYSLSFKIFWNNSSLHSIAGRL